jgi:hypothetical protein
MGSRCDSLCRDRVDSWRVGMGRGGRVLCRLLCPNNLVVHNLLYKVSEAQMSMQNFEVYASPEEKYQEFRRLILEQIKNYHPDTNGDTQENQRETRRWNKQLEVLERVWAKWQKDNA